VGISDGIRQRVEHVREVIQTIQALHKQYMKPDVHYAVINDRKVLLQPGAQMIALALQLSPKFDVSERRFIVGDNEHVEYTVKCTLQKPDGAVAGEYYGVCSTAEPRYRFSTKVVGEVPSEYWNDRDVRRLGGEDRFVKKVGDKWCVCVQVEAEPAPFVNTVLKMACKRAFVGAVISVSACSDIFTQDLEDFTQDIISSLMGDGKPSTAKDRNARTGAAPAPTAEAHAATPSSSQSRGGGPFSKERARKELRKQVDEMLDHAAEKAEQQPDEQQLEPESEPPVEPDVPMFRVANVQMVKEGTTKAGKPYKLFAIDTIEGLSVRTFDMAKAETARAAMIAHRGVNLAFRATKYGNDLTNIHVGDKFESGEPEPLFGVTVDNVSEQKQVYAGQEYHYWTVSVSSGDSNMELCCFDRKHAYNASQLHGVEGGSTIYYVEHPIFGNVLTSFEDISSLPGDDDAPF